MVNLGQTNTLSVIRHKDFGVYLDGEQLGDILLPRKYAPDGLQEGDQIEVFVYLDSEDRPVATTQRPRVQVGQCAFLQVKDTNRIGAFLDWGLGKDLLVPFAEQHKPMEVGKSYLVHAYLDRVDNRPTASSKLDRFLADENRNTFKANQKVDLIIANSTDLGYKAIINHTHWGLIFKQDVNEKLKFGQKMSGFIKRIREDGRIDLSLQDGKAKRDQNSQAVLAFLNKQGGFAAVHDKSDPKLITRLLGMSKAAFKKAIGGLYKAGVIKIESNGIRLIDKDNS